MAYLVVATLLALPRFRARAASILEAQRSRGLRLRGSPFNRLRAIGPITFPLLLGALAEVDERGFALETRCASAVERRTALAPPPDRVLDRAGAMGRHGRRHGCGAVESPGVSALDLRLVDFTYPGAPSPALSQCTLRADAGAVTWLTGTLGSGTSTALLVAAGLAPRHTGGLRAGQVRTLGADPADASSARELGGRVALVLPSPASQLSGIAETVAQEVAFAPANLGWAPGRIHDGVAHALDTLGHFAPRGPGPRDALRRRDAARGHRRHAGAGAGALAARRAASALDAAGRALLHRLLRAEAARGAAVVVASEDADGLAGVADRLVVFEAGRPVLDGSPDAVLRGDPVWEAGAGSTTIAALARAAGVAAPRPLTVDEGVARWAR